MHFRHLLISGLMVGAALFLPDNAFAEKNELSGQQNFQKSSGQNNPSMEMDNSAGKPNVPTKEKVTVVPEHAMKNQGGIKQQQSEVPPNNPGFQKSAVASKILPDQAKGNMQSVMNKPEKTDKSHKPEKVAPVQENNNGLEKHTTTSESGSGNSVLNSLHLSESEVKNKDQSVRLEPQVEDTHLSVTKKDYRSESLVHMPREKGDIPSGEEEIPKVSQTQNPTQRTCGQGGQSNDRVSQGFSNISFLDKWYLWNPYYEIQLVQSYLSRQTWLNNQWMNAPPSPPPKAAPILETVTRS